MIPSIVLGIAGGFAAVRLASRFRHGACGACHHGSRKLFWLGRYLDLDARQMAEVQELFHKVRASAGNLHAGKHQGLSALFEAFGPDAFDRARVEQAAARQAEALGQTKQDFIDALQRLHQILTPLQRDRLRGLLSRRFGRWGFPGASF